MTGKSRRATLLGMTALGLSLAIAASAEAAVLPVINLTVDQFNPGGGLTAAGKNGFNAANPVGWTGGTGLIAIGKDGTETDFVNGQYGVYGPFPPAPPGGNYIQADGNPDFGTSFYQNLTGLIPGTTYTLSFWQAAGQQNGFSGATTEQWIVALSTGVLQVTGVAPPASCAPFMNCRTYGIPGDPLASIDTTPVMNTPSQGVSGWQQVTVSLKATAANEIVSFLAWGNNGSTDNLPPTVFLAGFNSPSLVPEPASLALLGAGMLGLFGGLRARRSKTSTEA